MEKCYDTLHHCWMIEQHTSERACCGSDHKSQITDCLQLVIREDLHWVNMNSQFFSIFLFFMLNLIIVDFLMSSIHQNLACTSCWWGACDIKIYIFVLRKIDTQGEGHKGQMEENRAHFCSLKNQISSAQQNKRIKNKKLNNLHALRCFYWRFLCIE